MLRALVIEDDAVVREAVAHALTDDGFEVHCEAGGSSAEQVVTTFRPDIVLLDIGLHDGSDGLQVARRLRGSSDVPVLFVTGAHSVQERLAGFAVGADDYLTKPFAMEELLAWVRAICSARARRPGGSGRWAPWWSTKTPTPWPWATSSSISPQSSSRCSHVLSQPGAGARQGAAPQ